MIGPRGSRIGPLAGACALLGTLLLPASCGGGGGGSGSVIPAVHFSCSGVVAGAPDQISLSCPATSGSPMFVTVVIGGPTTSSDIYGIKFDLVFDPAVMNFQPPAVQGSFLGQGGAGIALDAASPPGDPARVVVSITRTGSGSGLGTTLASTTVVNIEFVATGVAGPTLLSFENAEAVDSTLTPIATLNFASAPLSISFQ